MKRVILDVDTGVDDAQAILLALKSPELKVEAITTVCGNVQVDKTSQNTLKVLELAGAENIPVAKGANKPLACSPHFTEFAHGKDGLANTNLPCPRNAPVKESAVDMIIRMVTENPGRITLISLGPMTNIAIALSKEPQLAANISGIVIMGGSYGVGSYGYGNITPVAEFNVWADPEAAWIVFHSGIAMTAVGLDVTQDPAASLSEKHLARFVSAGTPVADFVAKLSKYRMSALGGLSRLHDPMAVAVAVDKSLALTERLFVDVETSGKITRGMTVADRRPPWRRKLMRTTEEANVEICTSVDGKRFLDFFVDRLTQK